MTIQIVKISSHTGQEIATPEQKLQTYTKFIEHQDPENNFYQKTGLAILNWRQTDAAKNKEEFLGFVGAVDYDMIYLDHLPEEHRQLNNCNCCRAWFNNNAGAVIVDKNGKTTAVFLNPDLAPDHLKAAVQHAKNVVENMEVLDYYKSDELIAGKYKKGEVIVDGVLHGVFSHWHNAEVKDVTSPSVHSFHSLMMGFAAKIPPSDSLLTKAADYRKAILEIEHEDANVLSHIDMLDGYISSVKAIRRGRNHEIPGTVAWNIAYFNFRQKPTIEFFWGSAIGKPFDKYLSGEELGTVVGHYFSSIDPTKYKRAVADAADGLIRQAEKFITENGYAESINIRQTTRQHFIQTSIDTKSQLWASEVAVKPVKEVKAPTSLFGNLYAGAKDEIAADKVEKPTFKPKEITIARFISEVIPKAISMKYVRLQAGAYGNALQYTLNMARHLSFVMESGINGKPIWKSDAASVERCGERDPTATATIDSRDTSYLSRIGSFWKGSSANEFEITNVSIGRRIDNGDIADNLNFLTPDLAFIGLDKIAKTVFPDRLVDELIGYRSVIDQYLRDTGFAPQAYECEGFGVFVVGEAFPNNNLIVVETEEGFQPYDIRGSH